ncbi:MAG: general secretion pathway protein GspB [Gammaproteobacteria bacterium]|nr:general secretion pathway protein GspB [Gammaproteobacteria bacterium]
MSYILDALKKVQPERQADVLSQPPLVVVQYAEPDWQPRLLRLALWLVVVALLLLLAAAAWRWLSQMAPSPIVAAEVSQPEARPQPTPVTPAPAVTVVGRVPTVNSGALSWPPTDFDGADDAMLPGALEPALLPEPGQYQMAGESLDESVLPDFSAPASERQSLPRARPAVEQLTPEPQPLTGDLLRQQFEAAVAATASPAERRAMAAPLLGTLPAQFQKLVPPLSFSQHLYSSDGAQRWVRVNGRDAREGDRIAPEVTLERIEPQQVVMSIRGQPFALPALADWR